MANNRSQASVQLDKTLLDGSIVHTNICQEFIITTTDKLEIHLTKYQKNLKMQSEWIAPLGILISFICTLIATDFKETFGFSADFWRSLFTLLAVISAIWLLYLVVIIIKNIGKCNIGYIISQIKQESSDAVLNSKAEAAAANDNS